MEKQIKTQIKLNSKRVKKPRNKTVDAIKKNYQLYLLLLPTLVYFIVFHYGPMYGIQIAFRYFNPSLGFWKSEWAGLYHFKRFFNSYYFWDLIKNTLGISVYLISVTFPAAIIFALLINEVKSKFFKKTIQTVTYAPHFISIVIMMGMVIMFLSPTSGLINKFIQMLGKEPINFLEKPQYFKSIFVFSGLWQNLGWSTIVYLAALSAVDKSMVEASIIDGATRFQRVIHVNLPTIIPTIVIMLILRLGHVMNVGFEKVFLLQNPLNLEASNVISTYVYNAGLIQGKYSYATAIGLFNSVINFILVITVNKIAKRLKTSTLW